MGSYDLKAIVENFLTSGIKPAGDVDFMRRIRVLNITGLMLVVFASVWSISFLSHGAWAVGLAILAMVLTEAAVIVLMRRFHRPFLFSNITIGLLLFGISVSNWFTGGIGGANIAPYFIIPVIAVSLTGRWGLLWALATFLVMVGFGVLMFEDYVFPNVIPGPARDLDVALTWATAFFFLAALAYHYESTRKIAEQRIVEEKERAEEAARTKSQFLANMSHELRTPLNAILGLTDLTLRTDISEELRKNLSRVKEQAYSLLDMVEDVLDVSRMEAARLEIVVTPFDPRTLCEDTVGDYRARAESKGLQLNLELDGGLPAQVRGDAALVRKVLGNLLDNAVKFTDEGSISVRAESDPRSGLTFVVEDTGIGIPPDQIGHVFDAFAQVDASTTRRHGGSGLGLAICRQITEAMGGNIGVGSRPGRGTLFRIWLPFAEVRTAIREGNGRRILAVEDDEVGRELVETILSAAGYQVDTVVDGNSAVEAVGSGGYDLVLMDVQMPGMDGLGATRQIRSGEPQGQRVPIVAITAYALEEERRRCLQAGMDDFVTKPITAESLVKTVRRWVGEGKGIA
jgi:signal transduction histidine kinase/ActR/RegA family two-component response regulator